MELAIYNSYELGQKVNDDPIVYVFDDFLNETEVDELVNLAKADLQRALVSDNYSGVVSQGRTGQNCWIKHHATPIISQLSRCISKLVDIPLEQAESFQLIHYDETQKYNPHYDAWESDSEKGKRCMKKGGQRLITCLMYLNDVEEGGGTCFPKLDMEVRAIRGRMLLFHNCFPGTNQRHPDSLHGGLPVVKGEKWACNLWFRERSLRNKELNKGKRKFKRVI